MLDTLERVDIRLDTIVIDWDSEARCESQHKYSKGFCTVTAKYVAVNGCTKISVLWCEARYKEFLRTAHIRTHEDCHRMLIDCWKVRPL